MIDLSHLTAQEVFNQVVEGLASQGFERARANDGRCLYRAPNGRKCAAGWLIPDEDYQPKFDGMGSWSGLVGEEWASPAHLELIVSCQYAHDDSREPLKMKQKLRQVAIQFDLTIPPALSEETND